MDQPITLDSQFSPVIGSLVSRWSPDGERVAYLAEGERALSLWTIGADGSAVAFCFGQGHMTMGLAVLQLEQSSDGLPLAVGEPRYVVETTGTWHVHNGGWSADSRQIVYTRDMDYGDIFELVERQ